MRVKSRIECGISHTWQGDLTSGPIAGPNM